jgi:hypothetical protein
MCHQALGDFRREFTGFAQSFEPGLLAPGDLEVALAHLGALEKTAAALASMVAAEMAKVGKPRQPHTWSGWPTSAGAPTPTSARPWTGCSRPARPRAAGCAPAFARPTTASPGPGPTSPCSTCSTGSAGRTTP